MLELFRSYHAQSNSKFVIQSKVAPILGKAYDHYRCASVFDNLINWLCSHGVNGPKPLHTLRKEYGSQVAARFGIFAAQQMLGHRDISTTSQRYLESKDRPIVGLGHLLTASKE
jgi:integrase